MFNSGSCSLCHLDLHCANKLFKTNIRRKGSINWQVANPALVCKCKEMSPWKPDTGSGRHRHEARPYNGNAGKGSWKPCSSQWIIPIKARWCQGMNQKRERKSSKGWESWEGVMLLDGDFSRCWCPEGKMEGYSWINGAVLPQPVLFLLVHHTDYTELSLPPPIELC